MHTETIAVIIISFLAVIFFLVHLIWCTCQFKPKGSNKDGATSIKPRSQTPEPPSQTSEPMHKCHLCRARVLNSVWVDGSHRRSCEYRNRHRLQNMLVEPGVACGVCSGTVRRWEPARVRVSCKTHWAGPKGLMVCKCRSG